MPDWLGVRPAQSLSGRRENQHRETKLREQDKNPRTIGLGWPPPVRGRPQASPRQGDLAWLGFGVPPLEMQCWGFTVWTYSSVASVTMSDNGRAMQARQVAIRTWGRDGLTSNVPIQTTEMLQACGTNQGDARSGRRRNREAPRRSSTQSRFADEPYEAHGSPQQIHAAVFSVLTCGYSILCQASRISCRCKWTYICSGNFVEKISSQGGTYRGQ